MGRNRGKTPKAVTGTVAAVPTPHDFDQDTPKFCLRHLQNDYDVNNLTQSGRAAFAVALQRRSALTWTQLLMAPKHGLGKEFMPKEQIRAPIPPAFADADRFMVFRYDGTLPMAGVRAGNVFHILWIEKQYGDLYDHGS